MEVVLVSNLYPNALEPTRGVFTQQLVHHLKEHVNIRVIAPTAWRPKALVKQSMPAYENIQGIDVWHPRYLVIPKTARWTYGYSFYLGIKSRLLQLHQEKPIDLLNVHWAYPDAVGCVLAARKLGIPVVVHSLGCDINEFGKYPWRREQIRWALQHASMNVFVSQALMDEARALGVKHDRGRVILNGIDRNKFKPGDQRAARTQLGLPLDQQLILFAGNFNIEKGLIHLINAYEQVAKACPNARLCVVGSGPEEAVINERIQALGLSDKILLMGRVAHTEIPTYLQATDFLCLPSLREGCPNIVLEALASGAKVVASKVGAVPEMVDASRGLLVPPANPDALGKALIQALETDWSPGEWAWMSWSDNAMKVVESYRDAVRAGSI